MEVPSRVSDSTLLPTERFHVHAGGRCRGWRSACLGGRAAAFTEHESEPRSPALSGRVWLPRKLFLLQKVVGINYGGLEAVRQMLRANRIRAAPPARCNLSVQPWLLGRDMAVLSPPVPVTRNEIAGNERKGESAI